MRDLALREMLRIWMDCIPLWSRILMWRCFRCSIRDETRQIVQRIWISCAVADIHYYIFCSLHCCHMQCSFCETYLSNMELIFLHKLTKIYSEVEWKSQLTWVWCFIYSSVLSEVTCDESVFISLRSLSRSTAALWALECTVHNTSLQLISCCL